MNQKPTMMYWIVAVVALLWNLMGCWNYILQTNPDTVAQMPEVYQLIVKNRPSWATAGFAISVFGCAVGAILLLLRRKIATGLFVLSLIGTLAMLYFMVRVVGFDPATLSAVIMSFAMVWFATIAVKRGWTL